MQTQSCSAVAEKAWALLYAGATEEDAMRKNVTWTNKNAKRLRLFVVRTGLKAGARARKAR